MGSIIAFSDTVELSEQTGTAAQHANRSFKKRESKTRSSSTSSVSSLDESASRGMNNTPANPRYNLRNLTKRPRSPATNDSSDEDATEESSKRKRSAANDEDADYQTLKRSMQGDTSSRRVTRAMARLLQDDNSDTQSTSESENSPHSSTQPIPLPARLIEELMRQNRDAQDVQQQQEAVDDTETETTCKAQEEADVAAINKHEREIVGWRIRGRTGLATAQKHLTINLMPATGKTVEEKFRGWNIKQWSKAAEHVSPLWKQLRVAAESGKGRPHVVEVAKMLYPDGLAPRQQIEEDEEVEDLDSDDGTSTILRYRANRDAEMEAAFEGEVWEEVEVVPGSESDSDTNSALSDSDY